ncbi:sugar phosphate isomerase/epimerase family protein [Pelagibacterium limicola]|uniref:sugar phosphate isomerase/epimerase family protein n=1 Tax=Pelagibacterium limicola TaxID=2791022 RepID=UPI0018AFB3E1|nr:TIM barrel protein [Pelagibacterium limicola]
MSPAFAVSSWSLHRTIGLSWWESPDKPAQRTEAWGRGRVSMLDLPAQIAAHGYAAMHLCHFHVESRDSAWLKAFSAAMADAGVALSMLLIDDGDITHPEHHARDRTWIAGWIETAAMLGAQSARVIAGKQPPSSDSLALSAASLGSLAREGKAQGVRIVTENWFDLTPGPDEIDYLLDEVGSDLGLLADFGNWKGADKYRGLERILARAGDTHAKADFSAVGMDENDYRQCLAACTASGYRGPFTLIYDGPSDAEWDGLALERTFIEKHMA